jgi:hypothetical protein
MHYGKREAMVSLKAYKREKLRILNQMHIQLSLDEEQHLMSMQREIDVDNFVHRLIMTRL